MTVVPSTFARLGEPIFNTDQDGNKRLIETCDVANRETPTLPPFEVGYDLGPLEAGVWVIPPGQSPDQGIWYPKPQAPILRPATLPEPVRITRALRRDEDFAAKWKPLAPGKSLPELGVDDQRYTLYRARVSLAESEPAMLTRLLVHSFSRDIVSIQVNGRLPKRIHPSDGYAASAGRNIDTSYARIGPDDFDNRFDVGGLLNAGTNEIVMLYENIGHEHGYVPMEELCGIDAAGLGETDTAITKPLTLEVATDLGGIVNGWHLPGADTRAWTTVELDPSFAMPRKGNDAQPKGRPDALLLWYRLEFELPASDPKVFMPWMLRINASGNGDMVLNGHNIGRHFEAGPQREYYLPECWLHFGPGQKNVITLGLRQTVNGAVVRAAEIVAYGDAAEIKAAHP